MCRQGQPAAHVEPRGPHRGSDPRDTPYDDSDTPQTRAVWRRKWPPDAPRYPHPVTSERIFHIATRADWERTLESGTYTTSTAGRTLAEEGFIHASRREQVAGVFERYYRTLREPLVLLTIDPARLVGAELRVESVGDDTYPHIYGPINRKAVIDVVPLDRKGHPESFALVFLGDVAKRMAIAVLVMAVIAIVVVVARAIS